MYVDDDVWDPCFSGSVEVLKVVGLVLENASTVKNECDVLTDMEQSRVRKHWAPLDSVRVLADKCPDGADFANGEAVTELVASVADDLAGLQGFAEARSEAGDLVSKRCSVCDKVVSCVVLKGDG